MALGSIVTLLKLPIAVYLFYPQHYNHCSTLDIAGLDVYCTLQTSIANQT